MTFEHWGAIPVVINLAPAPMATLILAHGAGAGMDSDFMEALALRLQAASVSVIRFNFPYMAKMATTGKRRPPDKSDTLLATWRQVVNTATARFGEPLYIGGKSMGGRMATLLAATTSCGIKSVFCFGYPFHPLGKPEKTRIEHFARIAIEVNIFQGQRDKFGLPDEVSRYALPPNVEVCWLTDGDHDLKPRKSSGVSWEQNLATAVAVLCDHIRAKKYP